MYFYEQNKKIYKKKYLDFFGCCLFRGVNKLPLSTLNIFFLRLNVLLFFFTDNDKYIYVFFFII